MSVIENSVGAILLFALCAYVVIRFAISYYFHRKIRFHRELFNQPLED